MSDTYERTFFVAVPVERAWKAFTDPEDREAWMGKSPPEIEPAVVEVQEVDLHRKMKWSQSHAGLEGSYETTVTFEETTSGTRLTVVRSGFGDSEEWRHYANHTARGFDEILADFVVYLETGIKANRHFTASSGIAATMLQTTRGIEITHVIPGGFAEQAGMKAGDLLLRVNGVALISSQELAFFCREHAPGKRVEVEYVRGSEVLTGSGELSQWSFGSGEFIGHPGGYPRPALTGAAA